MRDVSSVFNSLFSQTHTVEWKIDIEENGTYYNADIWGGSVENGSMGDDEFSVGNAYSNKLNITVSVKGIVPKMAKISLFLRLSNGEIISEWLPKGIYYIDTRKQSGEKYTFDCYDTMLLAEQPFLDAALDIYPMSMRNAVTKICNKLQIECDNPLSIDNEYRIETPSPDMTMREMLQHIGGACCGNFVITETGKLRLVILAGSTNPQRIDYDLLSSFASKASDDYLGITAITMIYGDGENEYYTCGTTEGVNFTISCQWATQLMCERALAVAVQMFYRGWVVDGAYLHPAIEIGDRITLTGETNSFYVCNYSYSLSNRYIASLTAPIDTSIQHEFPQQGEITKQIRRKVSLGSSYEGVTISRNNGLEITRSDSTAKAIFNSREFRMQAKDDSGVLRDSLYFDPMSGSYKFVGDVNVQGGSMDIGGNFVVDQYGNVTLSGDSTIYGGRYYAGKPNAYEGYTEMTKGGFEVYNTDSKMKIKIGYSQVNEDDPFLMLTSDDGATDQKIGIVKKFNDGLWIGNGTPSDRSGVFYPEKGCNGIFFKFTDNTAYIVKDTLMKNIYTGDAVARFG